MQESFRRSHLSMPLFGALAVATAVATYQVQKPYVLTGAQLALADTGTGAGNTSAVVKVNGVAVTPVLSIAGAAAGKTAYADANASTPGVYPAGISLKPGDVVTVDITAVPATTAPKGGSLILNLTQLDV